MHSNISFFVVNNVCMFKCKCPIYDYTCLQTWFGDNFTKSQNNLFYESHNELQKITNPYIHLYDITKQKEK